MYTITVELQGAEAAALSQFCKRLTWSEVLSCSEGIDEAHQIKHAIDKLQDALADEGYAPR